MSYDKNYNPASGSGTAEVSLNEVLKPYLKKWYWFMISAILMGILTFFYLKTQQSSYRITSTVLIKDSKNIGGDFAALGNLSGFGKMGSDGVDNEIIVFQSKSLMSSVVKDLDLETTIWKPGFFKNTELYKESSPITVKVMNEKEDSKFFKKTIKVQIKGESLVLSSPELKKDIITSFGKTVSLPFSNMIILKNPAYDISKTNNNFVSEVLISVQPFDRVVERYQKMVDAKLANKDVTVIELMLNYPEKQKAIDLLNKMVQNYNRDALLDKNKESKATADFIDSRIAQIGQDLGNVESEKERFKVDNNITDIKTEAGLGIQQNAQIQSKLVEIENQIDLTNALLSFIGRQGTYQALPANTGLDNGSATMGINKYNELIIERNRLLLNATAENPLVEEVTKQIKTARSLIVESLSKGRDGLYLTKNNIQKEQGTIVGRVAKIPEQEKLFRSIERQQQIKESLYLLLLQKREETNITLAMKGEKARIIDYAYSSLRPVAPKKMIVLLGGILLGLLIPFAFIYLKELFNNKIVSKNDLEKLSDVTILGEIPRVQNGQSELIQMNDVSPLAEAFRIVVTNLKFLFPKKEQAKVLMVTSNVKGEGKTFISVNLSIALSSSSKRVLIIGSDIRNPQLQRYSPEKKNAQGLTEYLFGEIEDVNEIISRSSFSPNCDVIYSGAIPPNPTDLLENGRYETLLQSVEQNYEYIVLDCAPLMLVTDSFLIASSADATLYVNRSEVTEKDFIKFANQNIHSQRIKNVAFVLNDVHRSNYGYGNKYGYGYHAEEKSFFKRILEKLF